MSKARLLTDKKQSDTRDYNMESKPMPDNPVSQEDISKQIGGW